MRPPGLEGRGFFARQSGFAATSDAARSWYNQAMFEAHPDIAGTTVTFANIILDDNFLHEGTSFSDQPTAPADTSANLTRVQDGIVSLYNDPANKQAVLTMTGGDVEGNGIGINLNNKGANTARCLIYAGTVENNSRWDYYIETTKTGYLNGSYMYFSDSQLATAPDVGMQTNGKAILPTTDNTELYLGNASAAADTRLTAQVTAINSFSTVLATWFAQVPEKALHLTVADLAAQTDPVYVISYPVDAAGAIADDSEPVIYAVTQDTTDARNPIDVLASAGSANGRAYALFTSPDPMFAVSYESHGGSLVPPEAVPENGKATEPPRA